MPRKSKQEAVPNRVVLVGSGSTKSIKGLKQAIDEWIPEGPENPEWVVPLTDDWFTPTVNDVLDHLFKLFDDGDYEYTLRVVLAEDAADDIAALTEDADEVSKAADEDGVVQTLTQLTTEAENTLVFVLWDDDDEVLQDYLVAVDESDTVALFDASDLLRPLDLSGPDEEEEEEPEEEEPDPDPEDDEPAEFKVYTEDELTEIYENEKIAGLRAIIEERGITVGGGRLGNKKAISAILEHQESVEPDEAPDGDDEVEGEAAEVEVEVSAEALDLLRSIDSKLDQLISHVTAEDAKAVIDVEDAEEVEPDEEEPKTRRRPRRR